ncbi:MAG: hypothetical protein RMJ37_04755 [Spirochaetia bacterium]|nr:hypothetical protein [Spirochaetota bacterium]MCX8097193.1 hypothetical protein [Spirochaetota bacterium]MDW8112634.1 hypothetical protein [Spirochaetia bacterium]
MKNIIVAFLILLFASFCFAQDEDVQSLRDEEAFSKAILGISGGYTYHFGPENSIGPNIDNNRFLIGFNIGFASRGVVLMFDYLSKILPRNEINFNNNKVMDYVDMYVFSISYVFTIVRDYFYLGPSIVVSVDNSTLKFYNQFNFQNFITVGYVKDIHSRTVSLGVGFNLIAFRNVFIKSYFSYAFPNSYSYEGVNLEGSPVFQPTGLRVILNLCL